GVGDLLPAAAAQLRPDAPDPLRAARLRRQVRRGTGRSRPRRTAAGGTRRAAAVAVFGTGLPAPVAQEGVQALVVMVGDEHAPRVDQRLVGVREAGPG